MDNGAKILREAYYKEGYKAGEKAAAEQIFRYIDRLHLHVSNEYEARSYEALKKKYGVV